MSTFDKNDHDDRINDWITFLESRAMAVGLEAPSEADAYRMFETLNDRGLRTTQADLVKNYLFGRADDRINEVKHSWSEMQGALETIEDGDLTIQFLRHALTLRRGLVREKEVHDVIQGIAKSPQTVATLASQLSKTAATYAAIYNTGHERWNNLIETRKAVNVFNLVDVKPMRPLVLVIAEKMLDKEMNQTMSLCVSAMVRVVIAGKTRTGSVEKGFADVAKNIYSGTIKTASDLREELSGFIPSNTEFSQSFAIARVSNAKLTRYYLRSLKLAAVNVDQPWHIPNDNSDEINLEHVLPERTEGNWPQFSEDERRQYCKRIGNLCLLRSRDNSTLKSSPYRDKKPVYNNSEYKLTNQIAKMDEWTTSAIEERQRELSNLALQTWRF
ncbi:MAG: DUF1524 domain-containing protein [Synechococcus sp. SB0666_bin_14]|nr:DUF1524 domain-containing protein [Synechococcus sp. SB0666_bin_14]MYG47446.1 DUF1524 domain-containing protein [Synechococcus sp. SB0675_bin_6]MYK92251.1 DUF1524 domain-containing protein [Synechococcus sp. SB0669_bin_8]